MIRVSQNCHTRSSSEDSDENADKYPKINKKRKRRKSNTESRSRYRPLESSFNYTMLFNSYNYLANPMTSPCILALIWTLNLSHNFISSRLYLFFMETQGTLNFLTCNLLAKITTRTLIRYLNRQTLHHSRDSSVILSWASVVYS